MSAHLPVLNQAAIDWLKDWAIQCGGAYWSFDKQPLVAKLHQFVVDQQYAIDPDKALKVLKEIKDAHS